jgi:hypothetical protein
MDVATPNITPFTSNLKDENPLFISLMGTCPMLQNVDMPIGMILLM